jgi:hypothetical protein
MSDLLRSQLNFCCPMQALIAKAKVVLAIVPRVAMVVLIVKANFQFAIGLPSSLIRTATMATIEATLVVNARISKAEEAIVLREGDRSEGAFLS